MLPSRSRLQSWNPDSLTSAATAIESGGASVYQAIRELADGVDRMPETRTWQGQAHDAATGMFRRATDTVSRFKNYTESVAVAMKSGSASIAGARAALLTEADFVDKGELQVTDQWVVLIREGRVSEDKADSLLKQAQQAQGEINRLLNAVGRADDITADAIQAAAKSYGFVPPDPHSLATVIAGQGRPGDDVPDPSSPAGLIQQQMIRSQDMAKTIRDVREWETSDGQVRKTITMMDGSRHEIYEWGDTLPSVEDDYYAKDGSVTYNAYSQDRAQLDGSKYSEIKYPNGTVVNMSRDAQGRCTGGVTTADGRHGVLPDEFFTHPNLTLIGGALTGLEQKASQGGIPR